MGSLSSGGSVGGRTVWKALRQLVGSEECSQETGCFLAADNVLTLAACSGTCGNLVTNPVQDGAHWC